MSAYAVSMSFMRAVASTSHSGLSFTWRMNLPVPSNRPSGSASSAPRKNPTLTWALKALTYANAALPTHAVGWPSCNNSRTSSPQSRMTSNQRFAIAPNSPECSRIQASIAGSRLTEPGNRRSLALGSTFPAGDRGRLTDPRRHLRLVEVVLVDVDPARLPARAPRWNRLQRRASEEGHLDVAGEDVERQEPALALDAVEGRVPLHGLAHLGHVACDERVHASSDVALPARHGRDVGLHGCVTVGLRDLRVAACEESRLPGGQL